MQLNLHIYTVLCLFDITDVLKAKYGEEKVLKTHQVIVDACNQKCRNIRRKLKALVDTDK